MVSMTMNQSQFKNGLAPRSMARPRHAHRIEAAGATGAIYHFPSEQRDRKRGALARSPIPHQRRSFEMTRGDKVGWWCVGGFWVFVLAQVLRLAAHWNKPAPW